jgi:DNA invertase Pin-like site-specific DNA recombinase
MILQLCPRRWLQEMVMTKIGYARTSTTDQVAGFEAQLRDLRAAGCDERDIYREQASSVRARPALDLVLDRILRPGDTLVVTKIDRLARSIGDLVEIIRRVRTAGAELTILELGSTDPGSPMGELMVGMLGVLAQFERRIMLERQREGIARAKSEGKYRGQQPVKPERVAEVLRLAGEGVGKAAIARQMKAAGTPVSERSVYNILAEAKAAAASREARAAG